MTLYYTLVFFLLMMEMAMFMLLILPMPFTIKRKIFTFISENPIVAKIQYWMKITFVFILILFVDSVNRVYRVQLELLAATEQTSKGAYVTQTPPHPPLPSQPSTFVDRPTLGSATVLGHERLEVQARKFYSQRNMYLCGFTLFLSLILNRTYVMILEVMRLEDRLRVYEGTKKDAKGSGSGKPVDATSALQEKLEKKDLDLQTLKKQSEQLHKSYGELSDKYTALLKEDESRKSK
ncbi:B-cell receptor-associated 31-like protein [Drechmeria coniospora]|uniref:Endoplasmic reticulum transmembrane protein n=1 Tax=Drechmeria coniospora TaxID=98403 RepID=A0A151GC38_DRECN|nr:B-cell receptor-associated 31-like protein [Drechmeria coniospora]KYK54660.1 B-cell receptor-associated 31-like protein [Drechmeria coniospora]